MKIVYGMILAVLLASCSPFGLNPMGYEVLHEDLDTAWKKVSSMEYIDDPDGGYWKSPKETENDGGGDCEDLATYLVYLLGKEASLLIIENTPTGITHAIVKYRGIYMDAPCLGASTMQIYNLNSSILVQNGAIWKVLQSLSYGIAMTLSTNKGSKGITSIQNGK